MTLTRREVIHVLGRVLGSAAVLAKLPACGDNIPPPGPFTDAQRRTLGAFADVVIPPDTFPGGKKLGAVPYIERLLAAFDVTPPAIFANGPFSGRTAFADGTVPDNSFATFVELDRVSEAAWRQRVGEIHDLLFAGIDAAIAAHGPDLDDLSPDALSPIFDGQDEDWKNLMIDLVSEAAFAAPEYGGNFEGVGWKLCHFEGDRQPLGYTDAEVSQPNPGADPEPIDDEVDALMKVVVAFLGGRMA